MKYFRALAYITYVVQAVTAVTRYMRDGNEEKLARALSGTIYDTVDYATKGKAKKRISRQKAVDAAEVLADLIDDAMKDDVR